MKISPTFTFWITFITAVAQGITSGVVHLSGLVPESMLPKVTGWLGFLVFVNMLFLSMCSAYSSSKPGPLAAPPTIPEAKAVMEAAVKGLP